MKLQDKGAIYQFTPTKTCSISIISKKVTSEVLSYIKNKKLLSSQQLFLSICVI